MAPSPVPRRIFAVALGVILVGASVGVSAAAPPPKPPAIAWTPASVDLIVARGSGTTATAALTAANKLRNLSLSATGEMASFVTLSPASIPSVTAGATVTVGLTVAVPIGAALGDFGGTVVVSSGRKTLADSLPVTIHVVAGFLAIAAGQSHTCALTDTGGVKCWGANDRGQLGSGTFTSSLTPVDVTGLTSGVIAISAGDVDTCAVTSAGGAKCWGYNSSGQLGDGTTTNSDVPVDVVGLTSGVAGIAAGGNGHTCAVTTGGGAKCWGFNGDGELGDGTTTASLTPVDVSGLTSGVAAVAAGNAYSCALTTGGGVKCWGYNGYGQLGNNSVTRSLTPVDVFGLTSGVAAITTGSGSNHTCALTAAGGAKCWGANGGALGNDTTANSAVPVDVSGLTSGVAAIAADGAHTCAVTGGGGTRCWGSNANGELGDGTTTTRLTPVDVSGLSSGTVRIATGWYHSCASTTAGGVKCWGYNASGQLGDGTTINSSIPVDVSGL